MSSAAAPRLSPVLEAARAFTARGWHVVPIEAGSKRPPLTLRRWQALRLGLAELPRHFSNGSGCGLLLGDASAGLVDVDLDCSEAVHAAGLLLPTA